MKPEYRRLLTDLLTLPTAPFCEEHVIAYIRRWVADRPGLTLTEDRYGNLQIRVRRNPPRGSRPLVLAAHMDHPGFEAEGMIRRDTVRAFWRGWVAPEYFKGTGVRFWVDGAWVRGRITATKVADYRGRPRVQTASIRVPKPVPPGSIGMWDLPDPAVRGSRLYARGIDDVAGVAAVLAATDVIAKRREPVNFIAQLNRAEEVGFVGAIAACRDKVLPRNALIVSVETSSELAGGKMGEGPILRVGDLSSIFTPDLTAFCRRVAEDLVARTTPKAGRKGRASRRTTRPAPFRFQRKLMDGGTCEAAAYCGFGYEASGICIALGNYHNMDRTREKIASEFVDLNDWDDMVRWFVELAIAAPSYRPGDPKVDEMLDFLHKRWHPLLEGSVDRVRGKVRSEKGEVRKQKRR